MSEPPKDSMLAAAGFVLGAMLLYAALGYLIGYWG